MPFVETEASVRYETINGKRVPVITPKTSRGRSGYGIGGLV